MDKSSSPNYKVDVGAFIAERQSNGTFLYKSKETQILTRVNKSKDKDKPHYKVLSELQEEMKSTGSEMIRNIEKDLLNYLSSI